MQDSNLETFGPPLGLKKQNSEQSWESTMDKRALMFKNRNLTPNQSDYFDRLIPKIEIPANKQDFVNHRFFNNPVFDRFPSFTNQNSFFRLDSIHMNSNNPEEKKPPEVILETKPEKIISE